ncbi:MAG: hypothetical protein HDQ97_18215 [Lachnospiraceae bacterium]|nr:hypothetical protein [Lachnospiraceae bacterium]
MSDILKKGVMERLELDFNVQTPIASYNYTSFIGGVMFANNMDLYPYYLSKHILLLSNDLFDVSCDDMIMFEDANVFEEKKIRNSILESKQIKEDIIEKINDGYYASVTVDEFYIPNRYCYNKKSYYHDMLIYGFDLNENVFYTAGYDISEHFNTMKCNIEVVADSISKCLNERKAKPHFHYYKCKKNCKEFEIESVKDSLNKYLNGEPIKKIAYNGKYGINAYEGLKEKYSLACENDTYWRKASFSMLCEHKKLMLDRVKYINLNYNRIDNYLIDKFDNILKISKNIQINSLKYEFTKRENLFRKINDKIEEMKGIETKAIEELIKNI